MSTTATAPLCPVCSNPMVTAWHTPYCDWCAHSGRTCTWGSHPEGPVLAVGTTPGGFPICRPCARLAGLPVVNLR